MSICFCKCENGGMAKCLAGSLSKQRKCHWFEYSTDKTKCLHFVETIDDHCWSFNAQDQGLCLPDNIDYEEDLEISQPQKQERRCCLNCILFSCEKTTLANQASRDAGHGGLTETDLWNMASSCSDYLEDK
jgi:hypothetical protein